MSTNFNFLLTDFPNDNIDTVSLGKECETATTEWPSITYDSVNVEITFQVQTPSQATMDAIVAAHQGFGTALDIAKRAKSQLIDDRTQQLVNGGFEYPPASGIHYSLAQSSQTMLLALYNMRNEVYLTYPIRYNSLHETSAVDLANAAMVEGFFLTAVGSYRWMQDSGTAIKDEVRACTTIAEVNAVVDPR